LKRAILLFGCMMATTSIAQDTGLPMPLTLRFEANANRLVAEARGDLDRIAALMRADDLARLVIAVPMPIEPRRRRLLVARQGEVTRQLAARGLHAEFQSNQRQSDDDSLTLSLTHNQADPIVRPVPPPNPAAPAVAAPIVPVEPVPSAPIWQVEAGPSLQTLLRDFAGRAGWTVIWRCAYDYKIEAPAELSGDFAAILPRLLSGFSEARPAPTARIFTANHVVIIE
jgi:hypothetical protein